MGSLLGQAREEQLRGIGETLQAAIPVVKGKGEKMTKEMLSKCEKGISRRYLWKRSCTNRNFQSFDRYLKWLVGCLNFKQQIIEQASADAAFEQLNRRAMLSTFPYRSACWPVLWPGKWGRYQIARHGTRPDPRVSCVCACVFLVRWTYKIWINTCNIQMIEPNQAGLAPSALDEVSQYPHHNSSSPQKEWGIIRESFLDHF